MKSLWLFGIVLLFAFLFAYASAATNWCAPSVVDIPEEEWEIHDIVVTSYDADCQCYPTDIIKTGNWFGEYCNAGFLHETRTMEKLRTPECKDKYFVVESRDIAQDFCKKCPEPRVVGDWTEKGCVNEFKVYERKVVAQVFSPLLDKCYKQNFVEFNWTEESCTPSTTEDKIVTDIETGQNTNMFSTLWGQYWIFAVGALLIVGLLVYRKRVNKK